MIQLVEPGVWPQPARLLGHATDHAAARQARRIINETGHVPTDLPGFVPSASAIGAATHRPGILLTRAQLETWAGRPLTDDDLARLEKCIPGSSIPDAIATIAAG